MEEEAQPNSGAQISVTSPWALRPKSPPSPAALPGDPEQGQQGWVQGGRRAGRAGPRQAVSPREGTPRLGVTEDGT